MKALRNNFLALFLSLISCASFAAVTLSTAAKNAMLDALTTTIGNAGLLVIGDSTLSGATGVLCTITLGSPVAPAASGAVLAFTMPKTCTAGANGTAAKAEIRTAGGTVVVSGLTVGTSGTDVIVDNTNYANTQVYSPSQKYLNDSYRNLLPLLIQFDGNRS